MRLIYEKDGKFYKSESGIPEKDGVEIGLTREQVEGYALVYEKDGEIRASETGIPNEDDVVLYAKEEAADATEESESEPEANVPNTEPPATEPEVTNPEEPEEPSNEDELVVEEENTLEDEAE